MSRTELHPTRLGIIGSGRMARTRAENVAGSRRARLVAVAARNEARGQAFAAEYGCDFAGMPERLLARDDINAVLICTHNASHGELALAALDTGRHVLVEYPLCLDVEDAEKVLGAADRADRTLWVAHDQVWLGPHAEVRAAIGRHGPPLDLSVLVAWAGAPAGSAFRNARLGGPPALVKPYYLYAILDWLGLPIRATASLQHTGLQPDGHYDAAVQHLVLTYRGTIVRATWSVDPRLTRRHCEVELIWEGHSLRTDGERITVSSSETGDVDLPLLRMSWRWGTARGLTGFLDAIERRSDMSSAGRLALETVRLGTTTPAPAANHDAVWRAA